MKTHNYKKEIAFKACKITETQLAHSLKKTVSTSSSADRNTYEFQEGAFTPH